MSKNKHVQMTWTNLSYTTQCKVATKEMFDTHFRTKGLDFSRCEADTPFKIIFKPDQDTPPRSLEAWCPGGEISFGKFIDAKSGEPLPNCERSFLVKQGSLLEDADLQITIGFELEFYLLNLDGSPVDSTEVGDCKAFQGHSWKIITEVVDTLTSDFDIPVWLYHPENGAGQFEISIGPFGVTGPNSLVNAADSLVLTREAIHHITAKHNKKATFVPKPFEDGSSGIHVHVSLQSQRFSENLFKIEPKRAQAFLAGILKNLPNFMAVFAPTGNSYERLHSGAFPGTFHCYGTENKAAAIRLIMDDDDGLISRFEVKPIDGTANPYLALGAMIGAGLQGIFDGTPLPEETKVDPETLPIEQRPPTLPGSLSQAIKLFEENEFCQGLFGKELHQMILKLRVKDQQFWDSVEETRENKMKILLRKY